MFKVLAAIQFYDQFSPWGTEIYDVVANSMLAAEICARQLMGAQVRP